MKPGYQTNFLSLKHHFPLKISSILDKTICVATDKSQIVAPKAQKWLLLTFLDFQKHGSRKLLTVRTDLYKIDGVNGGSRVNMIYQMKEGEERSRLVVFVLLGGR